MTIYKIEEHVPTKKYVFSHVSLFDNVLTSKVVESTLPILTVAMLEFQGKGWDLDDEDIKNLEDLKNFAFNCEVIFEIIEI